MTGASTTPTLTLTNPSSVTANYPVTSIGTDGPKCWTGLGEVGTYAFRADVTAAITGAANGTYTINSITGSAGEQTDWEIDGATLIIIYKNTSAAWKGSLIIDDGEYTLGSGGTINYTMTGFTACSTGSNSTAFMIFSDLQDNTALNFSPTLNGTAGTFLKLFWNYCEVNTTVNSGQSSSSYSYTDIGDCYSVCLAGLYFQTTTCATCSSPSGLTLTTSNTVAGCSLCNGTATVSATGGTTPYTYTWSTTPAQTTATASNLCAGTYTVTVVDASGCNTGTASVTVTSSAAATVIISPAASTICSGNSVTLTASGTTTYSWSPPAGLSATTGDIVIASPTITTTYTVTGTATGCTGTSSVIVTVDPPPIAQISFTPATCGLNMRRIPATGWCSIPCRASRARRRACWCSWRWMLHWESEQLPPMDLFWGARSARVESHHGNHHVRQSFPSLGQGRQQLLRSRLRQLRRGGIRAFRL